MSGISGIYFLDLKGRIIIFRNYRGEVFQSISENFQRVVLELEEINMKPAFSIEDTHYTWLKHQNIYIVAVSRRNVNICQAFAFLHKLIDILIDYFKNLEEESIRDNFVIIYELLDEIMDHGYPQTTESKVLKEYIKSESNELNIIKKEKENDMKITKTITNLVSWRTEGISHQKNEIYLDVIEKVNSLISSNSSVLRSEVIGVIKAKCQLSGMPALKLGLNDKILFELTGRATQNRTVDMDDLKFHQCVNMNKFESERSIEFTPPDGEFELMNYRLNMELKPLFWVEVVMTNISSTRIEYKVKARANFKSRSVANNVEIMIPVPSDTISATFKTNTGSVKYVPDQENIVWYYKRWVGQVELDLKVTIVVPTVRCDDATKHIKRPIAMKYEIPYFTVSGIQVRYLQILDKSGYHGSPWVRYITTNGDFHIRMI